MRMLMHGGYQIAAWSGEAHETAICTLRTGRAASCDPPQTMTERATAMAGRAEAAEAKLGALRHELEGARARLEQSEEENAAAAEQVLDWGVYASHAYSILLHNRWFAYWRACRVMLCHLLCSWKP